MTRVVILLDVDESKDVGWAQLGVTVAGSLVHLKREKVGPLGHLEISSEGIIGDICATEGLDPWLDQTVRIDTGKWDTYTGDIVGLDGDSAVVRVHGVENVTVVLAPDEFAFTDR